MISEAMDETPMDLSLKTCAPGVAAAKPRSKRAVAHRCAPKRGGAGDGPSTAPSLMANSGQLRRDIQAVLTTSATAWSASKFRWRSDPEVVANSLKGMSFTFAGTLESLTPADAIEMVECCGGRVFKTLAAKSQYLVTGLGASHTMITDAKKERKTLLNEKEFLDLVKEKGRKMKTLIKMCRQHRYSTDPDSTDDTSNEEGI